MEMKSKSKDSPAVIAALSHIEAWSNHQWDKARKLLAPDVHVIAMTTQPNLPTTDLTGIDAYMEGLKKFAEPIEKGSAHVLSSIGDENNALITLTVKVALGPGPLITLPGSRLYLFDENKKLKSERIVFFALSGASMPKM